MRGLMALAIVSTSVLANEPLTRPRASSTSESSRLGSEYIVQRAGATWVFQLEAGKGRLTINSFSEWRAHFSFTFGKRSGSGAWFSRAGAWMERSAARGGGDAVVLPAVMSRGSQWSALASLERGGGQPARYEVVALDAQVELPTGLTVDHCLAVLETAMDGGDPHTHYFAPNVGKVAVMAPGGWLYRLVEFRSGARHSE